MEIGGGFFEGGARKTGGDNIMVVTGRYGMLLNPTMVKKQMQKNTVLLIYTSLCILKRSTRQVSILNAYSFVCPTQSKIRNENPSQIPVLTALHSQYKTSCPLHTF